MYSPNTTISTFLDAAAAKQPSPGGGSVAALVGALAAAMGEMVVNYSVGKKGLEAHQGDLREALDEFTRARGLLLALMVEDQNAYESLTAARKLPEGSPERQSKFPVALLASIRTPQAISATAAAVLGLCDGLVSIVNYYLLSDLAVAADLAMATVRCGVYNVRVNLADVTDPAERHGIEAELGQVLANSALVIQRVIPQVWARHAQGK
ncbi:MAG TPA: cyclodeaminase/cyclohydrolase family protein [Tepidisphaeraceae bacterium]|nr:cyclodeaminase/cyclohydrolase family protein [Tepidisphaeraceae bacterium]